jgi:hypothetical protein
VPLINGDGGAIAAEISLVVACNINKASAHLTLACLCEHRNLKAVRTVRPSSFVAIISGGINLIYDLKVMTFFTKLVGEKIIIPSKHRLLRVFVTFSQLTLPVTPPTDLVNIHLF